MVNYYITKSSTELSVLNSSIYESITIDIVIPISDLNDQDLTDELLKNNFNVNDKVVIDMINVENRLNLILNSGYTEYILYYSKQVNVVKNINCQCTKYGIYKLMFDIAVDKFITFDASECNFNHNNISEFNMEKVSLNEPCEVSFEDNSISNFKLPSPSYDLSLNLSYNNITSFDIPV